MKPSIVLMNFTHVYEQEHFINNSRFTWIDCTDLHGTDCYLDAEAEQQLKERIKKFSPHGIHFIDSGNYHYLTKLWTDKIHEPFSLIVFDHHPDMQPSLFDGLMSCGCWVKTVIDTNPWLRKVILIGASEKLFDKVPEAYRERVRFYSESTLSHDDAWRSFSIRHLQEPVYVSVDKDVLNTLSAVTNWDQGSMPLTELEKIFSVILRNENVIGVDVCGECSPTLEVFEEERDDQINGEANKELLNLYLESIAGKHS